MADGDAPRSFRDPAYDELDAQTSAKLGLPLGLLVSVRTNGERSNADQVSDAGARTVYQITKDTRDAAIKKWGIDPYLSAQNASEVAGLLLKDSLDRNGQDPAAAVGEYIGGTDRANWGRTTKAYINRVMSGIVPIKTAAMADEFQKWMAANPSQPGAAPAPAPTASPLDRAFSSWMKGKQAGPEDIPVEPGANTAITPKPEPSLADKAIGAGEAALTTATGMTGGAVGTIAGTVKGLADAAISGKLGTAEGAREVERTAAEGANALTYQPRTATGQEYAQNVENAAREVLPAAVVVPGMVPHAGEVVRPVAEVATNTAREAAGTVSQAAQAVRDQAVAMTSKATKSLLGVPDEPQAAGAMGSVGAAGTDPAAIRRATASQLPVPMELTTGQATRNHQQLRFEGETAKGELGQPLRENAATQNAQLAQNFEALIDSTGAEAPNTIEAGRAVVDNGLVPAAAKAKAKYRALYQEADKAGELEEPVSLQPLADYLNANRAGRSSAPILGTIADELKVQGVGDGALADGTLSAGDASLKTAEAIRKTVNRFVKDNDPNDVRVGSEIKGVIDQITDGKGGSVYQEARAARQRYAQLFENNAIVSDLLRSRRGTADRQVALEDVFNRTILNGSREDLSMLRRTLQVAGGEPGHQAWRELQGATLRYMLDQATQGVGSDIRGNPIFSAAKLNNGVRALESGGRLDFVLGRRRAQMVRDLNEIAKVVTTVPPGALNTSNTASVILAAIAEAGATGGLTGLPIPVLSTIRAGAKYVRDRSIRQRVMAALGRAQPAAKSKAPQRNAPRTPDPSRAPESRTVH
jgi:hypothetical protein